MNNRIPEWNELAQGQVPPSYKIYKEKVAYENNDAISFPYEEACVELEQPLQEVHEGDFVTFVIDGKSYSGRLQKKVLDVSQEDTEQYETWLYIGNLGIVTHAWDMSGEYLDLPLTDEPFVFGFETFSNSTESYIEFLQIKDNYDYDAIDPDTKNIQLWVNGKCINEINVADYSVERCGIVEFDTPIQIGTYNILLDSLLYKDINIDENSHRVDGLCNSISCYDIGGILKSPTHHKIKIFQEEVIEDNGYGWEEKAKEKVLFDSYVELQDAGEDFMTNLSIADNIVAGEKYSITINDVTSIVTARQINDYTIDLGTVNNFSVGVSISSPNIVGVSIYYRDVTDPNTKIKIAHLIPANTHVISPKYCYDAVFKVDMTTDEATLVSGNFNAIVSKLKAYIPCTAVALLKTDTGIHTVNFVFIEKFVDYVLCSYVLNEDFHVILKLNEDNSVEADIVGL